MSSHIGKEALVIGAGMAGLVAAQAVSNHFEHVLVLERDDLPPDATHRAVISELCAELKDVDNLRRDLDCTTDWRDPSLCVACERAAAF